MRKCPKCKKMEITSALVGEDRLMRTWCRSCGYIIEQEGYGKGNRELESKIGFIENMTQEKTTEVYRIIGMIAVGIVIGMVLSWVFMFISIDSFVNNILPKVQIGNINFDLNETALVNDLNNTFGGIKK
jgi:hypothetical protein